MSGERAMTASNTKIRMRSGRLVDVLNPTIEDIDFADIAWGLARQPRFLAQSHVRIDLCTHSDFVAWLVRRRASKPTSLHADVTPFITAKARLHDAQETYVGDKATPVLNSLAARCAIVHGFMEAEVRAAWSGIKTNFDDLIDRKLSLTPPTSDERDIIKFYDKVALEIEGRIGFADWQRDDDILRSFDPKELAICFSAALRMIAEAERHAREMPRKAADGAIALTWLNHLIDDLRDGGMRTDFIAPLWEASNHVSDWMGDPDLPNIEDLL
ncbi:hypothetical protein [Terrarubrum flagellatum]|uniref:hypothetical protein n=1 Tax=Terrirubrum flagellatum TaxID=2895980 RepID=UPI0031451B69